MDYREFGDTWYIRVDKGEEIISEILAVCQKEGIKSAVFSGIGGCEKAEIQTFLADRREFETEVVEGMLELVSLNGNVGLDEGGAYCHHTHALVSYKTGEEHHVAAGHIKSLVVLYTAEIELRPVIGGTIRRVQDPETGTKFWDF